MSEYDTVLSKLQKASIKTEGISATLNAGQSVILSIGLTAVLAVAALGSQGTTMTAGDLVLVQGLLLQLWGPLQVSSALLLRVSPGLGTSPECIARYKTWSLNRSTYVLQFLGWFYRELRQSLVDLDAFLKVHAFGWCVTAQLIVLACTLARLHACTLARLM